MGPAAGWLLLVDRESRTSVDPTSGTAARGVAGGLMSAGLNGNQHRIQGMCRETKWSPRMGAVYSLTTKTIVRTGYGLLTGRRRLSAPKSPPITASAVGSTHLSSADDGAPGGLARRMPRSRTSLVRAPSGNCVRRRSRHRHQHQLRRSGTARPRRACSRSLAGRTARASCARLRRKTVSCVGAHGDHLRPQRARSTRRSTSGH